MKQIDAVLKFLYEHKDDETPILLDTIQNDKELLEVVGNRHELVRIINKLKTDNYLHHYPDYPKLPDGKNDMKNGLLSYAPITFEGRLFWESGGYEKNRNREKVAEMPKKYWWLIAIITFIVGFFADVIKERLKQKLLPPPSKEIPILPVSVDTPQSHKNHPDTSQSPLNGSLKAFDSTSQKE